MGYRGKFDKAIFQDPTSGYCIFSIKSTDTGIPPEARSQYKFRDHMIRFTACGYGLPQTDAVEIMLEGEWESNKYGLQLTVEHWEEIIPPTTEGIKAYLASGLIKGIGPKIAEDIVNQFGMDTLTVIEQTPDRLLEIRGITENGLEAIKNSYTESRAVRNLVSYLAPLKVTATTALRIHQVLGANSLSIIRRSPFELCRIPGFGFVRVDDIARKTGCNPNDPMRIQGALFFVLDENRNKNGHLFLSAEDLCNEALALLNAKLLLPSLKLKPEDVSDEMYNVVERGDLTVSGDAVYLPRNYEAEESVALRVAEMLTDSKKAVDISAELEMVKREFGLKLSPKQEEAVKVAFRYDVSIITGSPGTGKTTVLKTVIEVFKKLHRNGKVLLTAPTGRASRRMAESTGFDEAKTLHSALGLVTSDDDMDYINGSENIDANLIVIDEFSMVDMWLASKLFAKIEDGTKVLFVGDADQLPSVGAGNVFREFIGCGLIPVTVLNQIFRQSDDSLIPVNAKFINENRSSLYYGNDFVFVECNTQQEASALIQDLYYQAISTKGIENVQILSPYREDGDASAMKLNELIRETINPSSNETDEIKVGSKIFRVNDRVMQTRNKNGISNGDVGFVRSITHDGSKSTVTIEFTGLRSVEYNLSDLGTIELAYAMTIHKAMGSEYDTVIVPMLSAHTILLNRNLVYTAITRAKHQVYLVGQKAMLHRAVHKNKIDKRNTMLAERITRQYEKLHTPPERERISA